MQPEPEPEPEPELFGVVAALGCSATGNGIAGVSRRVGRRRAAARLAAGENPELGRIRAGTSTGTQSRTVHS